MKQKGSKKQAVKRIDQRKVPACRRPNQKNEVKKKRSDMSPSDGAHQRIEAIHIDRLLQPLVQIDITELLCKEQQQPFFQEQVSSTNVVIHMLATQLSGS